MVAVISVNGIRLIPTHESHARRLLKKGLAKIYRYRPFAIQLLYESTTETQPVEYKTDTGYQHVGISICSEKHEFVNEQRDLLADEIEKYNDCRKYRRTRRNRLRYRESRFDNRKKPEGWLPPSTRNRMDTQLKLFDMYNSVYPITSAVFEMGKFDIQALKAIEDGSPLPEGVDYQHGEQYGYETLRQAVFTRDKFTCQCCGRSIKDNAILHEHHVGFWKGDRTNRMSNLMTVCEKCHTSANHQKNGKLYGIEPKLGTLKEATFMNVIRWQFYNRLKEAFPDVDIKITYGSMTSIKRKQLHITKTHANDAYAMGEFHPKHRAHMKTHQKVRRNSRVLEKFYDAKYIDSRTCKKASGKDLSCNRIKRKFPRNNPENLRMFHGKKLSKGQRRIRTSRYKTKSGDIIQTPYGIKECKGVLNNGTTVLLHNKTESPTGKAITTSMKTITVMKHVGGWKEIHQQAKPVCPIRPTAYVISRLEDGVFRTMFDKNNTKESCDGKKD